MPKTPRGKRVPDSTGKSFHVVNKAPNGQAEPFFDRTRQVWVAPWRKPDGKIGRPTGKTRALAVASRDRHIAKRSAREQEPLLASPQLRTHARPMGGTDPLEQQRDEPSAAITTELLRHMSQK